MPICFQKNLKYAILERMTTLIHADVFFFLATIWMFIISGIVAYILWHVAHIMKDLRHISSKIREGSDSLSGDLRDLHTLIHTEGAVVKSIFKYFKQLFHFHQKGKK